MLTTNQKPMIHKKTEKNISIPLKIIKPQGKRLKEEEKNREESRKQVENK